MVPRSIRFVWLGLAAAVGGAGAGAALGPAGAAAQDAPPGSAVFENVTVIPMDRERALEGQTVLIEGRRIVAIGPAGEVVVPDGALRIDGRGKYLIPGLAEMHGHIPSLQSGMEVIDRVMILNVANGITTIRGMLGNAYHLELRAEVARGERLGPQIFASSPSLNGNSVPDDETAWRAVTEYRAAGYDLLKIHPGIRREVFDQIAATARHEGIPFAGHVPAEVGLEHALESGIATVEHVDGYVEYLASRDPSTPSQFFGFNLVDRVDPTKIDGIARATRDAGAWVTPTQVLFENRFLGDPRKTAERPEMRFVAESTLQQWVERTLNARSQLGVTEENAQRFIELRRKIIKALHDNGVGLLLGADAPQVFNVPGFATIQELGAMVAAGLTPYQALEIGTKNPAIYLGKAGSFGTVEVGKRADLILLEANPLESIDNVRRRAGVMVAGRWLSKEDIERRLDQLSLRPK